MGYRVGAACYKTLGEAKDVFYSGQNLTILPGYVTQVSWTYKQGDIWNLATARYTPSGWDNYYTVVADQNFPICDYQSEFDAMSFQTSFEAGLVLFITGLGVGLVISILRKAKSF